MSYDSLLEIINQAIKNNGPTAHLDLLGLHQIVIRAKQLDDRKLAAAVADVNKGRLTDDEVRLSKGQ